MWIALYQRDERFFSKSVTHVVTTRPPPPELDPAESFTNRTSNDSRVTDAPTYTVNPSLLERNAEHNHSHVGRGRGKGGQVDVLHRARQMEMKIWTLDKLQRVVTAMHSNNPSNNETSTRSTTAATITRADLDLSAVLRYEQLNRPFDHNSLGIKDLVLFKGFFIYVYDYYGKTRPVMVRDYPRVTKRQEGTWPQFRSAALGKCPFIVDSLSKQEPKQGKVQDKDQKPVTKDNLAVQTVAKTMAPPPSFEKPVPKPQLGDARRKGLQCMNGTQQPVSQEGLPRTSFASGMTSTQPLTGYSRGEIAASGIQPSNITSAIRSQMISSTTAAPGAKAGTSKEIHELKRKVLEKNNGTISTAQRAAPSYTSATAIRVPPIRTSKLKALETLGVIPEDTKNLTDEQRAQRTRAGTKRQAAVRTANEKKDPKPGYCENCREKYDVFEEVRVKLSHGCFSCSNIVFLAHLFTAAS